MIEDVFPLNPVVWGLQTGPILIFQGEPLLLKMTKDEPARRMVAAPPRLLSMKQKPLKSTPGLGVFFVCRKRNDLLTRNFQKA